MNTRKEIIGFGKRNETSSETENKNKSDDDDIFEKEKNKKKIIDKIISEYLGENLEFTPDV